MKLGRVIGTVVATRKEGNLDRMKILLVGYLDETLHATGRTTAAIDTVNAGEGDVVLLCASSAARATAMTRTVATDNTIVGVVDAVSSGKRDLYDRRTDAGSSA